MSKVGSTSNWGGLSAFIYLLPTWDLLTLQGLLFPLSCVVIIFVLEYFVHTKAEVNSKTANELSKSQVRSKYMEEEYLHVDHHLYSTPIPLFSCTMICISSHTDEFLSINTSCLVLKIYKQFTNTHMDTHTRTHTFTYTHTPHAHTHKRTYTHTYAHAHTHTHTHTHTSQDIMHALIYTSAYCCHVRTWEYHRVGRLYHRVGRLYK